MASMDNVRERIEALEQQMEPLRQQTHVLEAQTQARKGHTRTGARRRHWWWGMAGGFLIGGLVSLVPPSHAADFACAAGDAACLLNAITTANANGEANTIAVEAGTYTLTAVDNTTDGPNGLPSVTSTLTIQGAGLDTTVIERDPSAPGFRLLHVAAAGVLTLDGLTLKGGSGMPGSSFGSALLNEGGTVAITHTRVADNGTTDFGGGLFTRGGTVAIGQSLFTGNAARLDGGGLMNAGGTVTITQTTFAGNVSGGDGGGLSNGGVLGLGRGTVTIMDSTLVDNFGVFSGGLSNNDTTILINTTTLIGSRAL
jgi:hypothetical protein